MTSKPVTPERRAESSRSDIVGHPPPGAEEPPRHAAPRSAQTPLSVAAIAATRRTFTSIDHEDPLDESRGAEAV